MLSKTRLVKNKLVEETRKRERKKKRRFFSVLLNVCIAFVILFSFYVFRRNFAK